MIPSSPAQIVAFVFFGALAFVSAIFTVALSNPIRNAVSLFVHVLSLAGLYITLSAHFLTAVQLIVYVGAVVVLFVFVIMLLGPASEASSDGSGLASRLVGAASMIALGCGIAWVVKDLAPARVDHPAGFGTLETIGRELFSSAVLPFELASVLLTAAMVGAFAVARTHQNKVSMTREGQEEEASR